MAKIPEISNLFVAAADIEADTPITVGANVVGADRRFSVSQRMGRSEWDNWARSFPLKEMKRLKFSLPTGASAAEVVLGFFDMPSPETWQTTWQAAGVAFRQTQVFDIRKEAVAAWVREAEIVAGQIPLVDFSEEKLRKSLDELRQLTREKIDVGLDRAQAICSKAGVAVVLVPELPRTRVSGCAKWLNEKHAMVGLTLRYKSDDQLWFTFFHELGHILLHRDRQAFVIDNAADYMGDGVVDPDMAKYEREADQFAADSIRWQIACDRVWAVESEDMGHTLCAWGSIQDESRGKAIMVVGTATSLLRTTRENTVSGKTVLAQLLSMSVPVGPTNPRGGLCAGPPPGGFDALPLPTPG